MKLLKEITTKLLSIALAATLTLGFLPIGALANEQAAAPSADEPVSTQPADMAPVVQEPAAENPATEPQDTVAPQGDKEPAKNAPEPAEEPEEEELVPLTQDVWAEWPSFRGNSYNNGIVHYDLPAAADEAQLLYALRLGSGWNNAVSTQLIVDNCLVFMSGMKIYKANLYTGAIVAEGDLSIAFNWGYTPFAYGEGKIFVSLSSGTIQAFDATSLESLWIYKDPLKGQSVSPVVYSDGYVYTGFWNSEKKDANYVCIKAEDEDRTKGDELKEATWSITNAGGYYWAGGLAVGNYLVFGGDDGVSEGSNASSTLRCVNKYTGDVVSTLSLGGMGDQRSAICYAPETGQIYFTTKAGYLCSAYFNAGSGSLSGLQSCNVWSGAMSTSTPVYYKGRLYFGIGAGYDGGSFCRFVVADASSLQTIASVQALGDVKASPLLSTATEESGYLCFYFTYNNNPGGISLAKVKNDCAGDEDIELVELYDAAAGPQYNIASVIATSGGVMYMKNDSGVIFAVGFTEEGRTAANQRHAEAFEQAVEDLFPITLESGDALAAVQSRAASLSAGVRELVSQQAFDRLDEAQAQYDALRGDYEAAQQLIEAVANLFPVTEESGNAIIAARAMADALTPSQRAYVPDETMADLVRAENEYQALLVNDKQVKAVIQAVAKLFPVTLESGPAIQHVQEMLDALNVLQMEKVPESVIASYREAQAQYAQLLADKEVAEAFEARVDALGDITLESGDAIAAAKEALAKLTDRQRSLVSDEAIATLTAARETYDQLVADKAAVDAFVTQVASIGKVTLESGPAIAAAEAARDGLTEAQLAKVSAGTLDILASARASFNELQEGKAAVDAVAAMVNDLGVITLESGPAIEAAEKALAALTPVQYAMAPPDTLAALQRARKNYDALVAAEEQKKNPSAGGETKALGNDTKAATNANDSEEGPEEVIYTASLGSAPKNGAAGESGEERSPLIWVIIAAVCLFVFGGAGRMLVASSKNEDEEKETK